jgi:hypothetical protein
MIHAGRVDHDVEPPGLPDGFADESIQPVEVMQVESADGRPTPGVSYRFRSFSQPIGVTSRNENVASLGSEGAGYSPADAGGRAGDDGNLILEEAHMNDHLSD